MIIFIVLHGRRVLSTVTGDRAGDQYVYTSPLCSALKMGSIGAWPDSYLDGTIPSQLLTKMKSLIYKTDCDPYSQECVPAKNRFEL